MADGVQAAKLFAAHEAPSGTVVALQGLTLGVQSAELLAVMGPSGSGKTTLLECLAGRRRPLAGELHSFGVPLHDAPGRAVAAYRARTVALVRQRYRIALSPDLPAWRIVALRPALLGWSRRRARERAHELLGLVGLADRAGARRAELSGGEQQRVALCTALAARPSLLLADEITAELDEASGRLVLELLAALSRHEGVTVVLATHDPAALEVATRAVTLRDGRVTGELRGRGAARRVVIDDSGVLRLDPEDLEAAGIGASARLERVPGGLFLRGEGEPARPRPETAPAPRRRVGAPPVVVLEAAQRLYPGGVNAVAGVSAELAAGRLHVLTGPSGCGKTTLLHLVAGLQRATSGRVHVLGEDLAALSRTELAGLRRRDVAIVPQSALLVGFLTCAENIEVVLTARGLGAAESTIRARRALEDVGLGELAGRQAKTLSAGQRQRVALARALATRPALLLADEPTANLDERNAAAVARLLAEIAAGGTTVLCATHDPSVEHEADEVLHMRDGRLAA